MSKRYPTRRRVSRFHRHKASLELGEPRFKKGDRIGEFTVLWHMGHSEVNKRNNHIMAKPQHWYRCECDCGTQESRSQQELIDVRRSQCCFECRAKLGDVDENQS